ncbi:MAG: hypothetical protein QNJ16_07095 [Rhodobacter sp.]|nr:hypothetical protein [Rhodobacter sp.]
MSALQLATIGTVLGGLGLFMLLPLIAHVGSVVLAIVSTLAASAFCFFLGRLIVRGGAGVIWPETALDGPVWAGGLPPRDVDFAIYALFVVCSVLATVAIRREKSR